MNTLQIQVQIGPSFPATAFFRSDGTVILVGHDGMKAVIDHFDIGISGIFDQDGFTLVEQGFDEGSHYQYNVPYKLSEMPVLRAWLKQQQLVLPQ